MTKQLVVMTVSWGMSSMTYDFTDRKVLVEDGEIVRRFRLVPLWVLRLIWGKPLCRSYGHGYSNRDNFWSDYDSGVLRREGERGEETRRGKGSDV